MKRAVLFFSSLFLVLFMNAPACFTAQYDFKTMTPDVDRALKGRQARYTQLQALKQMGVVGENNRGYVTCLKEDPAAKAVTVSENSDRQLIYRALVEQNALGTNGMYQVEQAFAEVQRDKAHRGEMIQSPGGSWQQKT